jgi:hypothetical protein
MRAIGFGIVISGALAVAASASGQASLDFDPASCPDRTSADRWCSSQLTKEGWTLKYKAESSPDLMDVYWKHEVWTQGRMALVCSHVGGRAGVRINGCHTLDEVTR